MKNLSYNHFILFLFLLFSFNLFSQSVSYNWTSTSGGVEEDMLVDLKLDNIGNAYVTGVFKDTCDFDPGLGVYNLISSGGSDAFLQKLDTNGNLIWAISIGGVGFDHGMKIVIDSTGQIYWFGFFSNTVDFDPGPGVNNFVSNGQRDVFIMKLDSSSNIIWVKTFGGIYDDQLNSVTIDNTGHICTTGYITGAVDMDPGTGVTILNGGSGPKVFVQKLDTNGDLIWAFEFGGSGSAYFQRGQDIGSDTNGNLYITGSFVGLCDFDPSVTTNNILSHGESDIFLAKYDSAGNYLWAQGFGSSVTEYGSQIEINEFGGVYLTGYFRNTVDFNSSATNNFVSSSGAGDVFVLKTDASGAFNWIRSFGGSNDDVGLGIVLDSQHNLIVSGFFSNVVDFNPGSGVHLKTSNGGFDGFIQCLDTNGGFNWVKTLGGTQNDWVHQIGSNPSTLMVAGFFENTVDFNPNTGGDSISSNGDRDFFITKLNFCTIDETIDTLEACDSLQWVNGVNYYTSTNSPTFHTYNQYGCDSIVTLDLTINNSSQFTQILYDCDSITWIDGNVYATNTQNVSYTLINSVGCDSVLYLDLTILPPDSTVDSHVVCDSLVWINGVTYYSSNNQVIDTLTNGFGCDSIVYLDLLVQNQITIDTVFACQSYTWINGVTYYSSNYSAVDSLVNYLGCDSLIFLYLTINPIESSYSFINLGSGVYSFINNSQGNFTNSNWAFGDGTTSDSINSTHSFNSNGNFIVVLTVFDSTIVGDSCFSYYMDTLSVSGVFPSPTCNAGFVIINDSNTANIGIINTCQGIGLTYLWDFGDGTWSTNQNPYHTYSGNGPYNLCVSIDDGLGCVDVFCDTVGSSGVWFKNGITIKVSSPLNTSVNTIEPEPTLSIYPNPVERILHLNWSTKLVGITSIYSSEGKLVYQSENYPKEINVESFSSGIYYISINGKNTNLIAMFLKK